MKSNEVKSLTHLKEFLRNQGGFSGFSAKYGTSEGIDKQLDEGRSMGNRSPDFIYYITRRVVDDCGSFTIEKISSEFLRKNP